MKPAFSIALSILVAHHVLASGQEATTADRWTLSYTRSLSGPESWGGMDICKDDYINRLVARDFLRFQSSDRQVDCVVGSSNRVVCASDDGGEPRLGAYDAKANAVVSWQLHVWRGEQKPVLFVDQVWLDDQRKPSHGVTRINFGLFSDWPAGVPRDKVERPDLIRNYCADYVKTVISSPTRPFGQSSNWHRAIEMLESR